MRPPVLPGLSVLLACCVPMWAQGSPISVENFPGTDLAARLVAADASLGARPGTISVNAPGRIGSDLTLHAGHGVVLHAPVTWAAAITLEGRNSISCEGNGARITAAMPAFHFPSPAGALLVAKGASGITVRGCTVLSDQTSMLLDGAPLSDLTMEGNTLDGLSLAVIWSGASSGLRFAGNSVTFPPSRHSDIAAVSLYGAKGVVATGNRFTRTLHGIQWWGGDSGAPGAALEQVTTTGEMHLNGNTCVEVGSCIWGSMGYGIQISGNTATGCGDVCFDTEGGRDTEISRNTASGCDNGCAAIFFFTRNTTMTQNHFSGMSPGGGLIFVKNASADPMRHQGLIVSGNTLECVPGPCRAVYAEAASGVHFENNDVVNGTYQPVNYARAVTIASNRMRFTVALPSGTSAIAAPALVGGTTLLIRDNTMSSEVAQAPGTACISSSWSDFNNSDLHIFAGNRCGGTHPFPVGIVTFTDGKNPGPHAFWDLSGNMAGGQGAIHHAATTNEIYRELSSCGAGGCRSASAMSDRSPCQGGNFGQLLPTGRGEATAICANNDNGAYVWIPVPGSR